MLCRSGKTNPNPTRVQNIARQPSFTVSANKAPTQPPPSDTLTSNHKRTTTRVYPQPIHSPVNHHRLASPVASFLMRESPPTCNICHRPLSATRGSLIHVFFGTDACLPRYAIYRPFPPSRLIIRPSVLPFRVYFHQVIRYSVIPASAMTRMC